VNKSVLLNRLGCHRSEYTWKVFF